MFHRSQPAWKRLTLALVFAATAVQAQTTGSISGRVTDDDNAVVPGVTVVAASPALQGTRTTTTDDRGEWRFAALPPGRYEVSFELSGFGTEKGAVEVGLGRDAVLN